MTDQPEVKPCTAKKLTERAESAEALIGELVITIKMLRQCPIGSIPDEIAEAALAKVRARQNVSSPESEPALIAKLIPLWAKLRKEYGITAFPESGWETWQAIDELLAKVRAREDGKHD